MIVEKPRIDRRKVVCEECRQRRIAAVTRRIQSILGKAETLGEPFRCALGIIIPVEPLGDVEPTRPTRRRAKRET